MPGRVGKTTPAPLFAIKRGSSGHASEDQRILSLLCFYRIRSPLARENADNVKAGAEECHCQYTVVPVYG